jgi:hypothetical protein
MMNAAVTNICNAVEVRRSRLDDGSSGWNAGYLDASGSLRGSADGESSDSCSVHLSRRPGEIHNLLVDTERLNLLNTKTGVMRSGYLHVDKQHDFVFAGRVQIWTINEQSRQPRRYVVPSPNPYIVIPPYVPHVFEFLQDTVMAEWWDGPFHSWFHHPYRQVVQESLQNMPGHFSHFVTVDQLQ